MNKKGSRIRSTLIYPDAGFYKLVVSLAIPIACQSLITIGVNITDTMMIGVLGETYLSASALATQYVNMFQTFTMGLSMGASVLAARYWGMREMVSLRKTIAIMMRLELILAFLFAGMAYFIPGKIMRMYSVEPDIIEAGKAYLYFTVLTFFLHGLSQGATIILRSVQKVKISLYVSIGAFLLNIVGNYLLIFGKCGFPAMGIAGASLSTLIVRIFECTINAGYLFFVEKEVQFRVRHLFMKTRDLLPEYIRISIPVLISDAFVALGNNTVMMIVGRIGESYIAANAVTAVIERLCSTGIGAVGQVSAMITGKTLGEGRVEEVQKQGFAFLGIGIFLGIISGGIVLLIASPVIRIYHLSGETAQIARQLFYASAIISIFNSGNGILTKGTLRGGGDTKVLMIADSIFQWVVSIPCGFVVGIVFGLPAFWIYFFLKIDNVCKTVWAIRRLASGKWIKKIRSFG